MRRLSCLLLLLMLAAVPALADSYTDASIFVTGTVTSTTVTLTFDCTAASCVGWYLGDVTLKGFTFTGNPTLGPSPAGYTILNGGQNNSSVGSGGGCNTTQPDKAVCWDTAVPLTTQLALNTTITFTANITSGAANPPLHFMATAYTNNQWGSLAGTGKVWAPSDDLNSNSITSAPEPDTLTLLGIGLLSIAILMRRQLRA